MNGCLAIAKDRVLRAETRPPSAVLGSAKPLEYQCRGWLRVKRSLAPASQIESWPRGRHIDISGSQPDDVVTAIDVQHLAGDARREMAQQINAGIAQVHHLHVAVQWGFLHGVLSHLVEM